MSTCVTHKKAFPSMEVAEDVLIESWIKFNYAQGQGPIAIYKCDDCGNYHFTSQGVMNAKLARHLSNGSIKFQKEASKWIDKIKRR